MIDGDTIEIVGQSIRFNGIDTPESRQYCDDAKVLAGGRQKCDCLCETHRTPIATWVVADVVFRDCPTFERDGRQKPPVTSFTLKRSKTSLAVSSASKLAISLEPLAMRR
jgi:hypothetical protein